MTDDQSLITRAANVLAEKMKCVEIALLYVQTLDDVDVAALADGDLTRLALPE